MLILTVEARACGTQAFLGTVVSIAGYVLSSKFWVPLGLEGSITDI